MVILLAMQMERGQDPAYRVVLLSTILLFNRSMDLKNVADSYNQATAEFLIVDNQLSEGICRTRNGQYQS